MQKNAVFQHPVTPIVHNTVTQYVHPVIYTNQNDMSIRVNRFKITNIHCNYC